jgi:hypothetical protein
MAVVPITWLVSKVSIDSSDCACQYRALKGGREAHVERGQFGTVPIERGVVVLGKLRFGGSSASHRSFVV